MNFNTSHIEPGGLAHARTGIYRNSYRPLKRLILWIYGLFVRRKQYRDLSELPDYLLEDIGLTRSEVKDATRYWI